MVVPQLYGTATLPLVLDMWLWLSTIQSSGGETKDVLRSLGLWDLLRQTCSLMVAAPWG